jgi:putative nucleotidyltransferase with HDIG domain
VSFYANALATRLGFNDVDIELVRFAGILHDIGKIGISDFILNKKGTLDPLEFALIQGHPGIGADMIKSIGFLENVGRLIRYHHERFNGTGYPDGLAFEKIPIGARIISVADAFDAMTCDRVYRPGMSYDEAIRRLIEGKGTQFDPKMVDCFIDVWENVLDNGRLAPQPVRTSGNMAVTTETIAETSSLVAATKE